MVQRNVKKINDLHLYVALLFLCACAVIRVPALDSDLYEYSSFSLAESPKHTFCTIERVNESFRYTLHSELVKGVGR